MKSMKLTTITLFFALSLTLTLFSAACTKKATQDTSTIYVGLSAEPSTLDPRRATDATGMRLTNLIFTSIVRLGPDMEIIGEAASRWSYSKDVYHFDLRPGLKFHDGTPVTKEDIEFSFAEYRKETSPFASALSTIDTIAVTYGPTGGTLDLKLKKFSASLLTDLSPVKLLPSSIIKTVGDDFGKKPIGSGPFKFVSADANEIRLDANKENPYAAPKINSISFKIVREENTRFLKVMKGELDLAQQELPPAKVNELEKKGLIVYKYPGLSMTYLLVNMNDPTLKSKNVRQALSAAINRDEIIRFKLEGMAQVATSILPPHNAYYDGTLTIPTYDLDKARAMVKAAGLEGKELTLKTSNSTQAIENGKVIASQLEKLGLKLNMQSFEWATFFADVNKGNFQLASMKWVGTTDPDIYRTAFHSTQIPPKGRNRGGYVNTKLDQLVDTGNEIQDVRKRIDHYKKVQRLVYEDLPIIPLWYEYETAVVSPKIKNFQAAKTGDYTALTKVSKE